MSAAPPVNIISCTQCGGELHPDEGQLFLTCPYCNSTVYLDKSQVVFHWYLAPTLDESRARGSLARWMSGSQTVKDLDQKARLTGSTFEYFPLWYFKRKRGGEEQILLEPASATSISEMRRLTLPAGDLRKYDPGLDSQAHPPSVPLSAALGWLEQRQVKSSELAERALVHIPLYTFKYTYLDQSYTAVVEGATGGVFANLYPVKAETPYALVGGLAALVYLGLALFPIIGVMAGGEEGAMIGMLLCGGLGALAAPVFMAMAVWVASKV